MTRHDRRALILSTAVLALFMAAWLAAAVLISP